MQDLSANNVNLSTAVWPCHQPATGCGVSFAHSLPRLPAELGTTNNPTSCRSVVHLSANAEEALPENGRTSDHGPHKNLSLTRLKMYMKPTYPLRSSLMLHNKGQSKRQ